MDPDKFPDGQRQLLTDDEMGMRFCLMTGFPPAMKLKDLRAPNRGDLFAPTILDLPGVHVDPRTATLAAVQTVDFTYAKLATVFFQHPARAPGKGGSYWKLSFSYWAQKPVENRGRVNSTEIGMNKKHR